MKFIMCFKLHVKSKAVPQLSNIDAGGCLMATQQSKALKTVYLRKAGLEMFCLA